jgi:hypothetical protein
LSVPVEAIPEQLKQLGKAGSNAERLPCVVAHWYQLEAIPKRLKPLQAAGTNKRLWCAVARCLVPVEAIPRGLYQWCWEAFMMLLKQPIRAYGSLGLMPIV